MVAAWASRNAEKTQVNSANPPSLLTIEGVAVATMLISIAERNIASITEPVMIRRPGAGVGEASGGLGEWDTARAPSAIGGITLGHDLSCGLDTVRFGERHQDRRGRPGRPVSTRRSVRQDPAEAPAAPW